MKSSFYNVSIRRLDKYYITVNLLQYEVHDGKMLIANVVFSFYNSVIFFSLVNILLFLCLELEWWVHYLFSICDAVSFFFCMFLLYNWI